MAAAAAEGTTSQPAKGQSALVGTTCMELALEGERLCKSADFKNGIRFFEEAIRVGTHDDRTLSAIYSQLGNAYFYLEDHQKALDYHKQDVALVHSIGDEAAEAKACGNLGNTFKMLGKFDEAAHYCRRYLEISRRLNDRVGEGRALYNLGNVYHTQGKRLIGSTEQSLGELSADIKSSLQRAIEYYTMNLDVVGSLQDFASMGRAYGNLGNTHYLLGNFEQAVECHERRLELARRTGDKSAERRAHLNLGNANVFIGNFPEAIKNYEATLKLAQELKDKYTEAHSCYSLANTYTFIRDYKLAIEYHLKYLDMIKDLDDKLGEGRACWSLVNLYQMLHEPERALEFARRHFEIAGQLADHAGLASAKLNIQELEQIISQKQAAINNDKHSDFVRLTLDKRQEQEQRRFKKQLNSTLAADIDGLSAKRRERIVGKSSSNERLFDMIAHFQSGRIDDQRCEIKKSTSTVSSDNKENKQAVQSQPQSQPQAQLDSQPTGRGSQPLITKPISAAASAIKATYRKASLVAYPSATGPPNVIHRRPTISAGHQEQLFELIAGAQRQRMDEQRASLPVVTVPKVTTQPKEEPRAQPQQQQPQRPKLSRRNQTFDSNNAQPNDDKFLDKLMKYQSTRFNDQRSEFPKLTKTLSSATNSSTSTTTTAATNNTNIPREPNQADNFFNMIVRFQSDRFEDQRSAPPPAKADDV